MAECGNTCRLIIHPLLQTNSSDLQQLRRRCVVREQIHSPLNDVTTGAAALVVLWLLTFAEDLDSGESTDLHAQNTHTLSSLCGKVQHSSI